MLSYKEYKLLNESLYGAFNLGLKSHTTVGGIVSSSPINGTEAAEEAIEEAKKAKKMKKKMDGEMDAEDHDDEEEVIDKVKSSDDDEDHDDDEDDEDDEDHDDDEDEDSKDDEDDEDEDEVKSKTDLNKKDFSFMKNKMKKKSKKEWSDVMSDLESIIEVVDDEEALTEVKKGLEMMKRGMEKGMKKYMGCGTKKCGKYMSEGENSHKCDCDCPVCNNKKDHDGEEEGKGLTAGQKKLPKALQDAILAKKGKKKAEGKEKKNMSEGDAAWWNSVNSMLGSEPDQKGWDGWSEIGEVQQAVRENAEQKKNSELNEDNSDINEISSALLDRASTSAAMRGDTRGGRLADKFTSMSDVRLSQEIESSPFKIQLNGNFYIIKSFKEAFDTTADEYVLGLRSQGMGPDRAELTIRRSLLNTKALVSLNVGSEKVYSVDRKTANIIANFVNSNGGQIRPTDLPLA